MTDVKKVAEVYEKARNTKTSVSNLLFRLWATLNNKSEAHSLKLSVTLMLKTKSLPLTSASAKPLKLPSKKISHSSFSTSLIAPARSSSPLSIRSLSLSSRKDSKRLFSYSLLAKFNPDG